MSAVPNPPRRFLRFSLRTFLVVTLALSVTLGLFGRVWLKAYRDSQPPTLHELAQIAKRHGIPMPPKEAKLVLTLNSWWFDDTQLPVYTPAFLLSEDSQRTIVVLQGTEEKNIYADVSVPGVVSWRPYSLDPAQAAAGRYRVECSVTSALLCAAQLAARGQTGEGEEILQRLQQGPVLDSRLPARDNSNLPDLRELVRQIAYGRIENLICDHPEQWPEARTRLATLLDESETLRKKHGQLRDDLAAAVDARAPRADSVEALLLAWSRSDIRKRGIHPGSVEILSRGFAAVPELIRLCEDSRLTRHTLARDDIDGSRQFRRVGDLAQDLLMEISGQSFGTLHSTAPQETAAETWSRWWTDAQAGGEREYCLANIASGRGELRSGLVRILSHKHPDTLLHFGDEYYRSNQPGLRRIDLAEAIVRCELPLHIRLVMIANVAEQGTFIERRDVLRIVWKLDEDRGATLLTALLDELPADRQDLDAAAPDSPAFPNLVLILDRPSLTAAYVRAARRNVSLRMELLSRLAYWFGKDSHRPLRLKLLSAFLDDETPRDRSLQSESFFSDDFPGITVRDFAAMHLANLLEIDAAPDKDWTPDQWSTLREQVRERLKGEELPELE
jgi:hypothetical protein